MYECWETEAVTSDFAPSTRSEDDRRILIAWAVACAQRVLHMFEGERPDDTRPREAIDGGLAWINGETTIGPVRHLAVGAHAAAREASGPGAVAAARSAGHAAAVAHTAGHARNAAVYALKAVELSAPELVEAEDEWQRSTVPAEFSSFVYGESD